MQTEDKLAYQAEITDTEGAKIVVTIASVLVEVWYGCK